MKVLKFYKNMHKYYAYYACDNSIGKNREILLQIAYLNDTILIWNNNEVNI